MSIEDTPIPAIAFTFFLVTNAIGNAPAIAALIKDYPLEKRKRIMLREGLFTLLLALFFQYFGEVFLAILQTKNYTVTMTGGILLMVCAFYMIFPLHQTEETKEKPKKEPYFVPIATPLLSGPGLLTIIMFYASQTASSLKITAAITLSWIGVMAVLIVAPYLQQWIGNRALIALERLMGMLLLMMGMDMVVIGILTYARTYS